MPSEKIQNEKTKSEKPKSGKADIVGKSPEEIEEDLQRRSLQFQILQASLQAIRERGHALLIKMEEMDNTKEAIKELKSVKSGSEMLAPIGSGNFISGKICDTEKILVGVGGGIAIKKSSEDALKFLETRISEAKSALIELNSQMAQAEGEMRALQSVIK